jgi:rubredoxin
MLVWLLFHHNVKTKVVKGGKSFVETCPECGRRARFDEVEVSENFGMFFVDLLGEKERKFRCSVCGDVFDLRDEPAPAAMPARSTRELEHERAAEEARRLAAERRWREISLTVRRKRDPHPRGRSEMIAETVPSANHPKLAAPDRRGTRR